MNNDHSTHLALVISWAGLLAGLLTPLAILLTVVFTAINIVIALRKLRRQGRLDELEARLKQPESTL